MKQSEIRRLASQVIGDGDSENNMWFVSYAPMVGVYSDEPNDWDVHFETLKGFNEDSDSYIFGPFNTLESALAKYDELELDAESGIGTVMIEDRVEGEVREKYLHKKTVVVYEQEERS